MTGKKGIYLSFKQNLIKRSSSFFISLFLSNVQPFFFVSDQAINSDNPVSKDIKYVSFVTKKVSLAKTAWGKKGGGGQLNVNLLSKHMEILYK